MKKKQKTEIRPISPVGTKVLGTVFTEYVVYDFPKGHEIAVCEALEHAVNSYYYARYLVTVKSQEE